MATYADDIDDMDELGFSAPPPIDRSAIEAGDFALLAEGAGPAPAKRGSAPADARKERRTLVLFVVGALLVVLASGYAVSTFLLQPTAPATPEDSPEQIVVAANESVVYREKEYGLVETPKGHALAELLANDEFSELGDIDGAPAALVLYKGALLVPQNLVDGTWEVQVYTIGSGWSQLVDADGKPQTGEGVISAAAFSEADGTVLSLTVGDQTVDLSLE